MNFINNKLVKNFKHYQAIAKKDGPGSALYGVVYELINKFTPFSVYRVTLMRLQEIAPPLFKIPRPFTLRPLKSDETIHYANDPVNDMSESFVLDAIQHGEECYGLFDGDRLASYAWYSDSPSHARRELFFFFNGNYKYRHKAFTYPKYRGLRLNVYNKAQACLHYSQSGFSGLLSIVEAHNYNSLRSNRRIGSTIVGDIAVIMLGGHYRTYANAGSRALGCQIKPLE